MQKAINILSEKFNTEIIITMGSKGMLILQDKKIVSLPTEAKEVYDVSGAGDTVIATLALANNENLEEAAILANHAASIVIQKAGTATVTFNELKNVLEKESSKIKTREELQEIIKDLKIKEKKIVHTNGSYDILHAGHLQTLRNSKKLGDILIVSINSDESVRKFKGAGRPILDQNERAALLASLEHVDYVTIFPEDDILKTLEMLKPNIHTKGGTFLEERVQKEKELLQSWNGEFRHLPMIEDKSTSDIIKRVLETTANEKIKPFKKVDKIWGREEWLINNDRYCLKQLLLDEGSICSYHYHRVKDETFLVKSGKVYIKIEDEEKVLNEGDMQRIAPGQLHYFASLTPSSVVLEISTHHEDKDSYRESESKKIDLEQLKKDLITKGILE
jgi:rfaE bifunctional protein nucleotidyltransferase chain/domain